MNKISHSSARTANQRALSVSMIRHAGDTGRTTGDCRLAVSRQKLFDVVMQQGQNTHTHTHRKHTDQWPYTQTNTHTKPPTHSLVSFHTSDPSFLPHCVSLWIQTHTLICFTMHHRTLLLSLPADLIAILIRPAVCVWP